jgi:hypothetical protein
MKTIKSISTFALLAVLTACGGSSQKAIEDAISEDPTAEASPEQDSQDNSNEITTVEFDADGFSSMSHEDAVEHLSVLIAQSLEDEGSGEPVEVSDETLAVIEDLKDKGPDVLDKLPEAALEILEAMLLGRTQAMDADEAGNYVAFSANEQEAMVQLIEEVIDLASDLLVEIDTIGLTEDLEDMVNRILVVCEALKMASADAQITRAGFNFGSYLHTMVFTSKSESYGLKVGNIGSFLFLHELGNKEEKTEHDEVKHQNLSDALETISVSAEYSGSFKQTGSVCFEPILTPIDGLPGLDEIETIEPHPISGDMAPVIADLDPGDMFPPIDGLPPLDEFPPLDDIIIVPLAVTYDIEIEVNFYVGGVDVEVTSLTETGLSSSWTSKMDGAVSELKLDADVYNNSHDKNYSPSPGFLTTAYVNLELGADEVNKFKIAFSNGIGFDKCTYTFSSSPDGASWELL